MLLLLTRASRRSCVAVFALQQMSSMSSEPEGALWSRTSAIQGATELTAVLERHLKDSRAVDTEALCIVAGEKVCDDCPGVRLHALGSHE